MVSFFHMYIIYFSQYPPPHSGQKYQGREQVFWNLKCLLSLPSCLLPLPLGAIYSPEFSFSFWILLFPFLIVFPLPFAYFPCFSFLFSMALLLGTDELKDQAHRRMLLGTVSTVRALEIESRSRQWIYPTAVAALKESILWTIIHHRFIPSSNHTVINLSYYTDSDPFIFLSYYPVPIFSCSRWQCFILLS